MMPSIMVRYSFFLFPPLFFVVFFEVLSVNICNSIRMGSSQGSSTT